jgi:hypothetical protein
LLLLLFLFRDEAELELELDDPEELGFFLVPEELLLLPL